ncbi:cysteine desulfurase-like protein [uncultured Imperialibacter sp.]|uniref:cysteine desulfurase-like protein n=1 Tax=uncultured Imperialibacter sp. TaxID=1672639 RepID=UPI0030DDAC78
MAKKSVFDPQSVHHQFPALRRLHNKKPLIFLDGPGGTQVPERVIRAISTYYRRSNANTHGAFVTTRETDKVMSDARTKMATLLGAPGPECISLGQNMTTINYSLARAMSKLLKPGDEVLITQLDHEANRGPWLTLRDFGVKVREVKLLPTGTLDYADFEQKLNENTRLVCMGMSSNAIGTVNDFALVRQMTYKVGAWLLLDAVHYAPHFSIDVQAIGCDFLICSAYKFYGPHVGIMYAKPGLLDRLPTDRLRTTDQIAPYSIETGTLNHAAMAGVSAAVDFIASLGSGDNLREKLDDAYAKVSQHEFALASKLYTELKAIKGITVVGQDFSSEKRTPTVSFTVKGKTAEEVCKQLAAGNICAWDGHFYAVRAIEVLGLLEKGGVTRMGISLYNTEQEIDHVIKAVKKLT